MKEPFILISKMYNQNGRYYHDIGHIVDLIRRTDKYGDEFIINQYGDIDSALYHAILWHDVVYVARSPNELEISNEIMSASLYKEWAKNREYDEKFVNEVVELILATEHHFDGTLFYNQKINFLLDIDILGFADTFEDFVKTQKLIDAEYIHVYGEDQKEAIKQKRLNFLKNIFDNRLLKFRYLSGHFNDIAYANIQAYLTKEGVM